MRFQFVEGEVEFFLSSRRPGDSDGDCAAGLVCNHNVVGGAHSVHAYGVGGVEMLLCWRSFQGADFGFGSSWDVCGGATESRKAERK